MAAAGLILVASLAACAKPDDKPSGEPNRYSCKGYPEPRVYVSAQTWWQREGQGNVVIPQQLGPGGVGGHMHVETCVPLNERVEGTVHFDVMLMSHQSFTGHSEKLDIGLAPGGESVARVPVPDMACGPKPQTCHAEVGIDLDTDKIGSGLQSLRVRLLPTNHPNGERHFSGSEWPVWVRTNPGSCGQEGSKGWYQGVNYANARFNGCGPRGTVSGDYTFDFFAKGDNVARSFVHVDARFGDDDFGTEVFRSNSEYRGPVTIETTRFTNGLHCLALRVDSPRGDGGTLVGIHQVPLRISNPGQPSGDGRGHCGPGTG